MIQWREEPEIVGNWDGGPEIAWTDIQPAPGLYHRLGVEPCSSFGQVKQAYRRLALQFHPDRQPASLRKEAERSMMELNAAYEVLRDPERRARYDLEHGISQTR